MCILQEFIYLSAICSMTFDRRLWNWQQTACMVVWVLHSHAFMQSLWQLWWLAKDARLVETVSGFFCFLVFHSKYIYVPLNWCFLISWLYLLIWTLGKYLCVKGSSWKVFTIWWSLIGYLIKLKVCANLHGCKRNVQNDTTFCSVSFRCGSLICHILIFRF